MRLHHLVIALMLWACGASAQTIGQVVRVKGEAALAPKTVLAAGSAVEMGGTLVTGPAARLEVRFLDGTTLTLGENARMAVDRFVYDPAAARGSLVMRQVQGAFLVASGGIGKLPDKPLKVITPVATIGIRGTKFWGGALENAMDVLVIEGAVVVENAAGRVELDQPLKGTGIGGAAVAPNQPMFWSQDRIDNAVRTVSFD